MSDFVTLREGIERKSLAVNTELGIQADIIRIAPNFKDVPHTHDGFEWAYILKGSLTDERGTHTKGDFIANTTEGIHQPSTGEDGCTLLIIWTGSVTKV
ncbi:MAG: cupin domain-containing protein [Candidatus Altiarchaeota archaeon]|nr:cupin domain-containing protein [Candidatus Altiarchaeota archaeon]